MTPEIGETFLLFTTAKEVWDCAKRCYSAIENAAAILQIKGRIQDLKQGEMSITRYYNTLMMYWQQLDMYETHQWSCGDDATKFKKLVEKDKIYTLLLSLHPDFDDVCSRVMSMHPMPSLDEVFAELKWEENRKQLVAKHMKPPPPLFDVSTMAVKGQTESNSRHRRLDKPLCDHCKKSGHTKEKCWKLHPELKPRQQREPRGLLVTGEGEQSLNKEPNLSN